MQNHLQTHTEKHTGFFSSLGYSCEEPSSEVPSLGSLGQLLLLFLSLSQSVCLSLTSKHIRVHAALFCINTHFGLVFWKRSRAIKLASEGWVFQ